MKKTRFSFTLKYCHNSLLAVLTVSLSPLSLGSHRARYARRGCDCLALPGTGGLERQSLGPTAGHQRCPDGRAGFRFSLYPAFLHLCSGTAGRLAGPGDLPGGRHPGG